MDHKKALLDERLDDPEMRALFDRERTGLEFVEQFEAVLEMEGLSRSDLATRLNKSRAAVTQALRRGSNLTINTMAELASAVDYELHVLLRKRGPEREPAFLEPLPAWTSQEPGVCAPAPAATAPAATAAPELVFAAPPTRTPPRKLEWATKPLFSIEIAP